MNILFWLLFPLRQELSPFFFLPTRLPATVGFFSFPGILGFFVLWWGDLPFAWCMHFSCEQCLTSELWLIAGSGCELSGFMERL